MDLYARSPKLKGTWTVFCVVKRGEGGGGEFALRSSKNLSILPKSVVSELVLWPLFLMLNVVVAVVAAATTICFFSLPTKYNAGHSPSPCYLPTPPVIFQHVLLLYNCRVLWAPWSFLTTLPKPLTARVYHRPICGVSSRSCHPRCGFDCSLYRCSAVCFSQVPTSMEHSPRLSRQEVKRRKMDAVLQLLTAPSRAHANRAHQARLLAREEEAMTRSCRQGIALAS